MHALHKVLVRIDGRIPEDKEGLEDVLSEARGCAENATDSFSDTAFDWRTTEDAGRWSDLYPQNVILSRDGIDRFVEELDDCMKNQRDQISMCIDRIKKAFGTTDCDEIAQDNIEKIYNYGGLFEMKLLAQLLAGDYVFDSMFFDADYYTAKITQETIEKVRLSPNNWALVMFDYHI